MERVCLKELAMKAGGNYMGGVDAVDMRDLDLNTK